MIQVSNTAPTSPMVKLWAYVKEEIWHGFKQVN
jgi:hypothetical protein